MDPNKSYLNVLLADDDADDRMFFEEALSELPILTDVTTVSDGWQLMDWLTKVPNALPDILFLDLNMPRKSGSQCLLEIRRNDVLNRLPVVIYSTSLNEEVAHRLYEQGASFYIRKPGDFSLLKKVILEALKKISMGDSVKRTRDDFVIEV